jgi:hypothetical protein
MIKFFRRIREKLLSESKFSKYLFYALGEIVLVVIGILIALQLNNWNTQKALKQEELKIIRSLHEEFSDNLVMFDGVYNFHLNRRRSIVAVKSPEINNAPLDSLLLHTRNIGFNYTFDPYQGIYNAIINSGKIELISNDSLKQRISKFQDLLDDYKEEEVNTMNFTQNNLYPFIIETRKLDFNTFHSITKRTEEEKNAYKMDLLDMIESNKYENILVYIYGYMEDTFTEGPILRQEMVSIINLLESEIE